MFTLEVTQTATVNQLIRITLMFNCNFSVSENAHSLACNSPNCISLRTRWGSLQLSFRSCSWIKEKGKERGKKKEGKRGRELRVGTQYWNCSATYALVWNCCL